MALRGHVADAMKATYGALKLGAILVSWLSSPHPNLRTVCHSFNESASESQAQNRLGSLIGWV